MPASKDNNSSARHVPLMLENKTRAAPYRTRHLHNGPALGTVGGGRLDKVRQGWREVLSPPPNPQCAFLFCRLDPQNGGASSTYS